MKKIWGIVLLWILLFPLAFAAEDLYTFSSPDQQQNFEALTTELRCLVCQNQNLAESNAPLAADLRGIIYRQVQQGHSQQEIRDYLVARYGNFILYRPPFNAATLGLWLGPLAVLLMGLASLQFCIRRKRD